MRDAFATDSSPSALSTPADVPYELTPQKMMLDNLLILACLFFIFYFILIRPQQKRLKAHQNLMKGLKKGDKILTNGGIVGVIAKFESEELLLVEVAPEVRIRVGRAAVSEVLNDKKNAANDA